MTASKHVLKFPQFSYKGFEFIEGSDIEIEFTDKYLKYQAWSNNVFTDEATELPTSKHWENIEYLDKRAICNISFSYNNALEQFQVVLYISAGECFLVYFKQQKDAIRFQKQLVAWRYYDIMPEISEQ